MKIVIFCLFLSVFLMSCVAETADNAKKSSSPPLIGTWKLLTGTLIEKGDTAVTDYTQNTSFIKIINDSHFAFLHHDLNQGKDSAAVFSAGGGSYTLVDSTYTEQLDYCSARDWEQNAFTFAISIKNDTLVQYGVEKVAGAGVDRINIEKYVRVKK